MKVKLKHPPNCPTHGDVIVCSAVACRVLFQITKAFAAALLPTSQVSADVKGHIATCLRGLAGQFSEAMGTVFNSLTPQEQQGITAALSGVAATAATPPSSPATAPSPPR